MIYLDKKLIATHIKEKKLQGYTEKKYSTFFDGKVLQICFYSIGCQCGKNGNCIMCDYGKSRQENLEEKDIKEIWQEVVSNLKQRPQVLLLNSLGSVLDSREMPLNNIKILLDEIAKIDINIIIFETHYLTINANILEWIKQKLPNKDIIIEMGLESSNETIREKCMNKHIDTEEFIEKVNLVKKCGFGVEINVIFGSPFLSTTQQIRDTIESIKWCFEHNIDEVNIFPMNIKPYTLLYELYKQNLYRPVKHENFIKMLTQLPEEYIDKIYLCWYGNRKLEYDGKETILPVCSEQEYSELMNFYQNFNLNKSKEIRLKLLREINSNRQKEYEIE